MHIKYALIENISHYIYPTTDPTELNPGSIIVTAVGVTEEGGLVRFKVTYDEKISVFLREVAATLINTDQFPIEKMTTDSWPGESKPKGTVWMA